MLRNEHQLWRTSYKECRHKTEAAATEKQTTSTTYLPWTHFIHLYPGSSSEIHNLSVLFFSEFLVLKHSPSRTGCKIYDCNVLQSCIVDTNTVNRQVMNAPTEAVRIGRKVGDNSAERKRGRELVMSSAKAMRAASNNKCRVCRVAISLPRCLLITFKAFEDAVREIDNLGEEGAKESGGIIENI